ncbi:hypothetical protein F4677DRAFT_173981 [Hypoxylon crocopeplum]|nr:hypothetical protein F4677DRAFT_173981 [Hypoxylon crocopeplum]
MLTNRRSTLIIPSTNRPTSYQPVTSPSPLNAQKPDTEPHCTTPAILTSTTPTLPGYRITRVLGAVFGTTAYTLKDAKSLRKAAAAASPGPVVEVRSLTHAMYEARDLALQRMARDCVARGANAVVAVAFDEREVLGFVQVAVAGTAVYVERERSQQQQQAENPFLAPE